MKKYLMTGIAAVAMCAAFTSCSHDLDFDQSSVENAVRSKYEAAFIKAFGQPAADQDWGFGTSSTRSFTRANEGKVIKPDMTNFPGYSNERCNSSNYRSPEGYADIVAPVTAKEAEWVQDWFSKNPGLTPQGQPFKNFFVQHVSNNGHTKAGYFHSTEGGKPESVEAKTYEGIYMDKLQIGATASEADTEHTLDFNATNGFNVWNLIYYENSSALQFGYHESYGSSYEWYFKCVELEVPGSCFADGKARKGWYVGLSYYCDKKETNEKWHVIGGDRLQYGDDWILKIVPNDPIIEETYDGRIMAEDLTAREDGDFDFNDVVFDYKLLNNETAQIQLRAAGGTLELYVGGTANDDMTEITGGKEVHTQFGVPINQMVNTGVTTESEPSPFIVDCAENKPVNIKIWVKKGGLFYELTAHTGKPASKFRTSCLTKWCDEYISISNPYPKFKEYVNDTNFTEWTTTDFHSEFADQNLSNNSGAIKGGY